MNDIGTRIVVASRASAICRPARASSFCYRPGAARGCGVTWD